MHGGKLSSQRASNCRHICGKGGHVLLESFLEEGADGGFGGEGGGGGGGVQIAVSERPTREQRAIEALELGAIHAVNDWESLGRVGKLAITRPAATVVGREVQAQGEKRGVRAEKQVFHEV
eukprot:jgi/Mesvir1/1160/Mv17663-RA.1